MRMDAKLVADKLLAWYEQNARILPFRQKGNGSDGSSL